MQTIPLQYEDGGEGESGNERRNKVIVMVTRTTLRNVDHQMGDSLLEMGLVERNEAVGDIMVSIENGRAVGKSTAIK